MTRLFDFDIGDAESSRLDGNESSSTGSNFNANRTRFCVRRLCTTADDNISGKSGETVENDDFNGVETRTGSIFGNESSPIIIFAKGTNVLLF
jgi:hypothetical protein